MAIEVLYSGESVRRAVRDLFRTGRGRRVALAAFVGAGAESYLRRVPGIEVYCWPSSGGTNPSAVRQLMRMGAEVHFADRLHAKVYWAEGKGAVITSANLSTNALGQGNLIEVGVRIPARAVDIEKIIRSARAVPVTDQALRRLDTAWKARATRARSVRTAVTFPEWLAATKRRESRWLLSVIDSFGPSSSALRERVQQQHGTRHIEDWVLCRRGEVQEDDYLLYIVVKGDKVNAVGWLYAEEVVRVSPADRAYDRDYPMQVGQVGPLRRFRPAPFVIDRAFRRAIARAWRENGPYQGAKVFPTAAAPRGFLRAIERFYERR